MKIDSSADNTKQLIEKVKAEAVSQDVFPLLTQTVLEALKTIPGIGQVLAAGEQLHIKRRVEYLEKSIEDLRNAAEEQASRLGSVERTADDERLTRLIYDGLTRAMSAQTDSQRHRTMRAVRSAILSPHDAETDYDEQAWMLRTADEMVETDADVLVGAFQAAGRGDELFAIPQEDDLRMASLERLRSFGFLVALEQTTVAWQGGTGRSADISALGKRFVEFALDDAVS